jgi:hypothetical protein
MKASVEALEVAVIWKFTVVSPAGKVTVEGTVI